MKRKLFTIILTLFFGLAFFLPSTFAQDYTQWSLPEGAKARLGKGGINDITCTQDGTLLAVASKIGIWIYDIQTGEELTLLTEHTENINTVIFSPDDSTFASGSIDGTVRLWNMNTWSEIGTFEGHTDTVKSLSFSPDGKTIVSRGDDNTLRLWDVATQTQIYTLEGQWGDSNSVSFSPDGQTIAIGGKDDIVRLWDVAMRTEIGTLVGHTGYVSGVSFSPDGKTLASGSNDYNARLWNVDTWTEIGTLEGHTGRVNSLVFSPDGKTLATGSNDGDVRLWDVATQTEITTFEVTNGIVTGVSFSPDGQTIAYRTGVGSARFLDVATQTKIVGYTLPGSIGGPEHTWEVLWVIAPQVEKKGFSWFRTMLEDHTGDRYGGGINSVSFSPDGKTLASGGRQDGIFLWDVDTQTKIGTLGIYNSYSVSFSSDSKTIASAGKHGGTRLWDVATQTKTGTLDIGAVNSVVFSPDGRTLASASGSYFYNVLVSLWDVATQTEIGRHWEHIGAVNSVVFSPDGRILASAGSIDATVRLWDVDTWTEIAILRGHTGWVNSVSFSPDGKTIVSGSNDRTVRLWDVGTRTEISTLEGHTEKVNSVSFSPDGHILASGSSDNTVRLWDTRVEIGRLEGHTAAVNSVDFSPDGRILASGSDDGTVLLWDIAEIEATSLLLGDSITAKIDPGNDVDYFNVQIEEFGQLTLWTTGTLDTIGTLQDSEGITLATNADETVNEELNFRIERYMYPGTYYIKVQSYAQMTGDYTIYAAFAPAKDVNGDGVVDVIDLVLVAENYGRTDATPAQGDVNGDGEVNREDINVVLDTLEESAAAPAAVSITESLQGWIDHAKQINLTDAGFQEGIAVLQNLLTILRETETVPKTTALLANYPNPFNPETWIPYQLAKSTDVTLKIYAADGLLVRKLALGHQPDGIYTNRNRAAYWDGKNVLGESVASGVYFYTLNAGEFTATRKMLIMK